jgi:hypothetical protein
MAMQSKNGRKIATTKVSCGQSSRILEKMGNFVGKKPVLLAQECGKPQNYVVTTIDNQKAKLYSQKVRTLIGLRLGASRTGASKSAGGGKLLGFLGWIRLLFNALCAKAAHMQTAW